MKFLLTVSFVAAFAAVSAGTSALLGSDDYGNDELISKRVQLPHKRWPQSPQSHYFSYAGGGTLSGISIVNNLFGSGAEYRVAGGGVGSSTVSIELTETGYGIYTTIKVYGQA